MIRIIAFSILAPLLLTACSPSCDFNSYNEHLQPYLEKWDDASAVANVTARIGLAGPIADMQAIRRDVASLDMPACAKEAHGYLLYSMDSRIQGFIAFMGKQPDEEIQRLFNNADVGWSEYLRKLDELRK
jgi:hypothetical protein